MRIHFVVVGTPAAASTRVRAVALGEQLRSAGHQVTLGQPRSLATARLLRQGGEVDVVVLQKVIPSNRVVEMIRRRCEALVVDLDDAIYLGYPGEDKQVARRRRVRLVKLGQAADLLTTPSAVIAADLSSVFAEALVHPGPAPTAAISLSELMTAKRQPAALWLGSPSTSPELSALALARGVLNEFPGGAVAVGATTSCQPNGFRQLVWTMKEQDAQLRRATVGLMPLKRSVWNDRKAAFKALEYAAWGVRPIASASPAIDAIAPVRAFCTIVESQEHWIRHLRRAQAEPVDQELVERLMASAATINASAYAKAWISAVRTFTN